MGSFVSHSTIDEAVEYFYDVLYTATYIFIPLKTFHFSKLFARFSTYLKNSCKKKAWDKKHIKI